MIIWGTEVTALQFFGYSIALGGMVYYKLGYEQIMGYAGAALGARKNVVRKLAIIVLGIFLVGTLYGTMFRPVSPVAPVAP